MDNDKIGDIAKKELSSEQYYLWTLTYLLTLKALDSLLYALPYNPNTLKRLDEISKDIEKKYIKPEVYRCIFCHQLIPEIPEEVTK